MLPHGTVVAHETGTIGGTCHDVGQIILPDGRKVLIAVMIDGGRASMAQREQTIAQISRAAYDYFLFK